MLTVDAVGGLRRQNTERQLKGLPFSWRFVEGYDSRISTPRHLYSPFRNAYSMKRSMTDGEIACYAGHRKIWRQVLEGDEPVVLVLEDDFQFVDVDAFMAGVSAAMRSASHWDMVKFFDFQPKRVVCDVVCDDARFVQYKYPASGMVAYLISRRACELMLRQKTIYRPVDEDLSYPWETGLRVWSMLPNPVTEAAAQLGGSLLEKDRYERRREEWRLGRRVYGKWLSLSKKIHSLRYRYDARRGVGPGANTWADALNAAQPPILSIDRSVGLKRRGSDEARRARAA